jgi:hypothetical protein
MLTFGTAKMNLKSKSFVLLALTTLAFAGHQTAVSTKTWKSFSTKDGKFTIKAPKSWGINDPNDAVSKQAIEVIKKHNPKLAAIYDDNDNQYAMKLFELGGASSKGVNNFNLKTIPDTELTPNLYPEVGAAILKETGMTKTGQKVLDLPNGKTLCYWGEMAVKLSPTETLNLKLYGYLMAKGKTVYICTMTTTPDQDKTQKPIYEAMAKSITLK